MSLIVRAFPVLPGKEEAVVAFARELAGKRREDHAEFCRRFGVVRETWHLQQTPHGLWVIGITELVEDPQAVAPRYVQSETPFDRWFKDQVFDITGIDPHIEPLGPPTERILDWPAAAGDRVLRDH